MRRHFRVMRYCRNNRYLILSIGQKLLQLALGAVLTASPPSQPQASLLFSVIGQTRQNRQDESEVLLCVGTSFSDEPGFEHSMRKLRTEASSRRAHHSSWMRHTRPSTRETQKIASYSQHGTCPNCPRAPIPHQFTYSGASIKKQWAKETYSDTETQMCSNSPRNVFVAQSQPLEVSRGFSYIHAYLYCSKSRRSSPAYRLCAKSQSVAPTCRKAVWCVVSRRRHG